MKLIGSERFVPKKMVSVCVRARRGHASLSLACTIKCFQNTSMAKSLEKSDDNARTMDQKSINAVRMMCDKQLQTQARAHRLIGWLVLQYFTSTCLSAVA